MKFRVRRSEASERFNVSDLLSSGETAVLYGDRRITVQGCRRILSYSTSEIRLQLKNCILSVRGTDLICSCFSGGCTTLQGRILCVEYQKNRGGKQR
jgi:sporulation protein YqfC